MRFLSPILLAAAFAAASVVTSESQRNNAHWARDVVLGAGIGTFSGIKVVRYNHGHMNNFIDRWLLGANVTPLPDGRMAVGWSSAR